MPRHHSPQFRERVVALVQVGRDVRDLSSDRGLAQQRFIVGGDRRGIVGVKTSMASELGYAKRRIRNL